MKPSNEPKSPAIRSRSLALKIHENPPSRSLRSEKLKEIIESSLNPKSIDEVTPDFFYFHQPIYSNVHLRNLLFSSSLDVAFIKTLNLKLYLWFESQDWLKFLSINDKIYPSLVYQFYKTLSSLGEGTFCACVKGKELLFDDITFGKIVHIPYIGKKLFKNEDFTNHNSFNKNKFVKQIFKVESHEIPPSVLRRSLLEPCLELFHYLLTRILVLVRSNLGIMNDFDLCFMWNVMHFVNLNLPHIMLEHMSNLREQDELPYAMHLTSVFKFFNINLDDEHVQKNPKLISRTSMLKVVKKHKTKIGRKTLLKELLPSHSLKDTHHFSKDLICEKISAQTSCPNLSSYDHKYSSESSLPSSCKDESLSCADSKLSRGSSPELSINSLYVVDSTVQNSPGEWKFNDIPSSEMKLSNDEIQVMTEASAQLPSVEASAFMDLETTPHNQMPTPLFFSHCNLQSGLLESIGHNPHFQYMEVPLPELSPNLDQANNFLSNLRNMSVDLDRTATSLDNHSRSTAHMMVQANEMAHLLTDQAKGYEHTLLSLSTKLDVLIEYVKNRAVQTDFQLSDMQRRLATLEDRTAVMSQRQHTLLGETYQSQMMIDTLEKTCRELSARPAQAESVSTEAPPPPVLDLLSQAPQDP